MLKHENKLTCAGSRYVESLAVCKPPLLPSISIPNFIILIDYDYCWIVTNWIEYVCEAVLCDAIIKIGATVLFRTIALYNASIQMPFMSTAEQQRNLSRWGYEKKEYLFMQIRINYLHVCTSSYAINFAFVTCKQCNLIHQLGVNPRGTFVRCCARWR